MPRRFVTFYISALEIPLLTYLLISVHKTTDRWTNEFVIAICGTTLHPVLAIWPVFYCYDLCYACDCVLADKFIKVKVKPKVV